MAVWCPRYVGFIYLFLLLLIPGFNTSQAADSGLTERITIVADRMESSQQDSIVSFSGHVEAKQGDLAIHADKMKIYYSDTAQATQSGKDAFQKIKKIEATGNVELNREDWSAAGDSIDYFANTGKVIITGNTKVFKKNNIITGERIVIDLNEGKSVVESAPENGGRVKAIINPQSINDKAEMKNE